jgi:tRNA(Ile)-lysidine synthase
VLAAVSGGADSTALLLCLVGLAEDYRLRLTVAHLNHRIRGSEGDADEDFVRRMSAALKLPYVSDIIEVKEQATAAKQNLEELARKLRYEFLRRAARKMEAQKIAVGHTLNDQAETALSRFIRGSGLEGLSAIHPVVDGLLIRPLLECSRDSILRYLKQQGAGYREDSTNSDLGHTRNRIRCELLPYLESHFNPQVVPALAREAHLAREIWSFVESQALKAFESLRLRTQEGTSLQIKDLLGLHPALQNEVLRVALRACSGSLRGITSCHIQSILSLCRANSGSEIRMPRGMVAIRQFDSLILGRAVRPSPAFRYQLELPGQCLVAESGALFSGTVSAAPDLRTMGQVRSTEAFFEPSLLPRFLTIRSRVPGDRYGGPGHRKVKKMLIGGRIPQTERSTLPLVVAGDDVIWIPGFRPARRYEARPRSTCVRIEMRPNAR